MENKLQKRLLIWSIIGFSLCWGLMLVSHFRYELLNIRPNYAPRNAGFNIIIFIPTLIISTIINFYVFTITLLKWKSLTNQKIKFLILILSFSVLFLVAIPTIFY